MNFRTAILVYALALGAEIFSHLTENRQIQFFSKPSLMPILIVYFFSNAKTSARAEKNLILAALVFSWLGDVLLLFDQQWKSFFMYGLLAFLAAHLAYIFYFLRVRKLNRVGKLPNPLIFAAIASYALILFSLLAPRVGNLFYPVALYAAVISVMFAASVAAFDFSRQKFGRLCAAGAFLFLVSDSQLAVNRFAAPVPLASVFVMLTYAAAQFLITEGSLRNLNAD